MISHGKLMNDKKLLEKERLKLGNELIHLDQSNFGLGVERQKSKGPAVSGRFSTVILSV